jgi:sec-independent protein translocase protein TatC
MPNNAANMPFLNHLEELRRRLIRVFWYYLALFALCAWFAEPIFRLLRKPMESRLETGAFFIATTPLSGWLTDMKIALIASAVLLVPFLIFEIFAFVTPGLETKEKRFAIPLTICASAFFYVGLAFGLFAVLPTSLSFLTTIYSGTNIRFLPDIGSYLDFALATLFGFGLIFILPFVVFLLIRLNVVQAETLTKARPYTIVGAFIVGAILTPPDVASQIMMSVPFVLLFELGLWMGRWGDKKRP